MADLSRVFTIPPGVPFLSTLADALLGGDLVPGFPVRGDPLALSTATIYLPNRRATRALAALLAERAGGDAALLPRIVPLGEADGAEMDLAAGLGAGQEAAVLAPALPPLERRLILTRLVQQWSRQVDAARESGDDPFLVPSSPADAVSLAADLEGLMDNLVVEGLDFHDLARCVEADYSHYFEKTREFVAIAAEHWPRILEARRASDPARRREALLRAEAERLSRSGASGPVVAAGSTGSIPSTARLLAAIAALPNGAVVLPGLDLDLDEAGWRAIRDPGSEPLDHAHGHPQSVMRRLLEDVLRLTRADVRSLGAVESAAAARARLVSQALRPAETTDAWALLDPAERAALVDQGCRGLAIVDALDEREEALAIAVALRETLEEPGRTAALITPDRALARRVGAEMLRWGVAVDDSAGCGLGQLRAGVFARLAAEAAALDFAPGPVLALLAHPDLRLGLSRAERERAVAALDIGLMRGPRPSAGLDGLTAALSARRVRVTSERYKEPLPRRALKDADWEAAADLLARLAVAFDGFDSTVLGDRVLDLGAVCALHRQVVERLATPAEGDEDPLFEDGSEEALATLFDDVAQAHAPEIDGRFSDYPAFFAALARERTLPPPARGTHRRVRILGLLEARLLDADRVVLGGLDEGVWPPRVETDAFLNRPMRSAIGLAPPERRIGQTAHDFAQALGGRDVVVTRCAKREGSPMVPSRFLQRLKALCGETVFAEVRGRGARYLAYARALDEAPRAPPLQRPAPKPNPALFPRRLSVTAIETLVRDPYSIFARHVLCLDELEEVGAQPGPRERGTLVHEVLSRFAETYPDGLPDPAIARERLLQFGADALALVTDGFPEVAAEWSFRLERLAGAFLTWEMARRPDLAQIAVERSGGLTLPLPGGDEFTLTARADRIERRRDGGFAIVDFKTGQPPSNKAIFAGFSPQLTLEAAMLMRGAFKEVGKAVETPSILHVHLGGPRTPLKPVDVEPPKGEMRSVADVVAEHLRGLEGLLRRYASGDAGYLSRPYPQYAKRFSAYDHLARVKEWSATGGGDTGEDGA
jgi:ATP-dependent helicase/nuclease subunit B